MTRVNWDGGGTAYERNFESAEEALAHIAKGLEMGIVFTILDVAAAGAEERLLPTWQFAFDTVSGEGTAIIAAATQEEAQRIMDEDIAEDDMEDVAPYKFERKGVLFHKGDPGFVQGYGTLVLY